MINAIHRRPAGKYLAGILGARLAVARAPPPFLWLGTLYTCCVRWYSVRTAHQIITGNTTNRELAAERRLTAAILPPRTNESD